MTVDIRLSEDDLLGKEGNALELFSSGIKSDETRRTMTNNLQTFLVKACTNFLDGDLSERAQQFVYMARKDQDKATNIILAYVKRLKERTKLDKKDAYYLNPSTVPNKIKPIKKLLEMNNIGVAWKLIYSTYPEQDNTHTGRGYSHSEIKRLLEYSNSIETDFIILASSSGGLRVGAWDGLTWNDVFPIYQSENGFSTEFDEDGKIVCGALRVYKGSAEEYIALISIEAWNKLEEIRKFYSKRFTPPKPTDPLLLERFTVKIPMTSKAIKKRLERLLVKSGIRQTLEKGVRRHQVPVTHGFRRFWNKIMMNVQRKQGTLSALVIKERLMGHEGLVKTDKNYFWTEVSDLVPEYLEAMPELIINDEIRLQIELENKNKELEKNQKEIQGSKEVQIKLQELEAKVTRMTKYQQSA